MEQSIVAIERVSNPLDEEAVYQAVSKAASLTGQWKDVIHSGDTVLLKPNMCLNDTVNTTNPLVSAAVVRMAYEAGAREVIVGDSSLVGSDTDVVYETTGTRYHCERAGARVIDLKDYPSRFVTIPNPLRRKRLKVGEAVVKADKLINIPKMKTCAGTDVSCALKNMKGVMMDTEKKAFHRIGLNQALTDLNSAVKQDFIVVDGICASELMIRPVDLGIVIAGTDPVAVDSVAVHIMGHDPKRIDHIRIAAEHGLGQMELDQIRVAGESIESVKTSLKLPPKNLTELVASFSPHIRDKISIIEGEACSGCISQLLLSLNRLGQTEPELSDWIGSLVVVIGPRTKLPSPTKNVLLVGNCTKRLKKRGVNHVEGCMPWSTDIVNGMKKMFSNGIRKRSRQGLGQEKNRP